MSYTCQSDIGKIKTVYIKRAVDAFIDEDTMREQWEALNFLDKPVMGSAMLEYEVFESLLSEGGAEIHTFPQGPRCEHGLYLLPGCGNRYRSWHHPL